jgi:two-component system, chemotaxis family, chemotaxis protein CheY
MIAVCVTAAAGTTRPVARVLLVDDDHVALLVARVICERAGHEVTTADDGGRALEAVASGLRPEIVVTDLEMPELDGIQLTRGLRATESGRALPVLIYSAAPVERLQTAAHASGATGWLPKPARPRALISTIERLLDAADPQASASSTASAQRPPASSSSVTPPTA